MMAVAGRRSVSDIDMEWLDLATLTRHVAVSERTLRGWIHRAIRAIDPLPPRCEFKVKSLFGVLSSTVGWSE